MKKLFYIAFVLIYTTSIAQNTADYTVFNYNLNLVNPAFTGKNNKIQIATNYKKVWSGIENSIHTSVLSFSMPLPNNFGAGIGITRDDFYLFSESIASIDISYKVALNQNNNILFGIKAQGAFFNPNLNKIHTQIANDPLFVDVNKKFSPNLAIGIALKNEDYFIHFSVLDILKNQRFKGTTNTTNNFRINTGGGFYTSINHNLELTTTALVRIIQGAPLSFDITSMLNINKKIDIGATYRWNNALMANVLIDINSWMQLGYSHGFPINEIAKYNNGTNEVFLRVYFDNNSRNGYKRRLRCF